MKRRGYSIWRRDGKGPWLVTWTDGAGKRRTRRASHQKAVAEQIGRELASLADRVRTDTLTPQRAAAITAGRTSLVKVLDQWQAALRAKGNTEKHIEHFRRQAEKVLAGADTLAMVNSDLIREGVGRSAETAQNQQHYFDATRAFLRWCKRTGRIEHNPVEAVDRPKAAGQTFQRQAFTDEDLHALIEATETRKARTSFKGKDRAWFYRILAYTGLRRSEARALRRDGFDMAGATIAVEAGYSKRRRRDLLPLPAQLLPALPAWLEGFAPAQRVFAIPKHFNFERVFKSDCQAAGIKAASGHVLGLHSLRRFYITRMIRAGGLAVAQDLARHSTPQMTKRYADLDRKDYDKALAGLPPVKREEAQRNERRKAIG